MKIILDAMGSDHHPEPEVQAAVEAARLFGEEILLVGQEEVLAPKVAAANPGGAPVRIVHAPDVFEMSAHISAGSLRQAKNSIAVGMNLLKTGEGDAFVTMGNTGGAMATGLFLLGRLRGVKRPALCAMFPVKNGRCVVADIGANTECKPEYLVQFALMGAEYARAIMGVESPRVGLLSNGEEAGKGNELVKATYPLLEKSGLNFIGNVEGKELFGGHADVVVTDGFTGNILTKSSEAVAKLMTEILREKLTAGFVTKIGALLAKPAFGEVKKMLDPAEVGAAPLLGLDGLVFVGHGRSDSRAIVSAIRLARQSVEVRLLESIRAAIEEGLKTVQPQEAGV